MPDGVSIRVNFSKPIPLFPLDQVLMLPQQIAPLHIFEDRYKQMVGRALDGAGQIAIAKLGGPGGISAFDAFPSVKPAVCVGQIVQHETLPDGRYNIYLQGVCRARILSENEPNEDRLYREAILEPVGTEDEPSVYADVLREWLLEKLDEGELSRLTSADEILKLVSNDGIPSPVLVEIISFAMVNDDDSRYALLAEGSLDRRTEIVRESLEALVSLIRKAIKQKPGEWPKGTSWN